MDPGALARDAAAKSGLDLESLPRVMDMNADTITENYGKLILSIARSKPKDEAIFERLVTHLHDFVREVSLTEEEWMAAIEFLTELGKCVLPFVKNSSFSRTHWGCPLLWIRLTMLSLPMRLKGPFFGPFLTADAHDLDHGASIASEGKGHYITTDRKEPDCRGRLHSREDGTYASEQSVPVPYGIPEDGPVAAMVQIWDATLFVQLTCTSRFKYVPGYETLTTALYFEGDPFVTSDVVFGVKTSLIVSPEVVTDAELGKARGFPDPSKPHVYLKKDFILPTPEEGQAAS
ncbi:intradiol ring-cleavage dioxygenase [Coprinopsis sp. MPI-PUGE-AT-0042]|nr:intradiol ring-cleavage dioxygenase [Coprinopsis sp. MPI-PUGE-AT-0042]